MNPAAGKKGKMWGCGKRRFLFHCWLTKADRICSIPC